MVLQRVGRRVGRRQHLDVEALEQRARPELGRGELLDDCVVHARGRLTRQSLAHAEHLVQLVIEPRRARRAAKQVIVLGE